MADTFKLSILARDMAIYDGQVRSIVAPGASGYLGILANHAALITTLVPGTITIRDIYGKTSVIESKSNGFLEVARNNATLLLDTVQ